MTTTETTATTQLIDTYAAMWNEADRAKRLDLIAQVWADECHYVDPLSDVTGHEGLADMVEAVRAQFPGATIQRTGDIDQHHDVLRFPWSATGPDGALILNGLDVAVVAPDGRLSAIAGFFDA
jgi:ketosteroid isomerase-like protein